MPVDLTMFDTLRAQAAAANDSNSNLTAEVITLQAAAALGPYQSLVSNLECQPGWIQPSNAGDTGGPSKAKSGTFLMTPGSASTPATFSARPNYAYNNGYFYAALGQQSKATRFRLALEFMLPTAADLKACQAIEFELQQCIGGMFFNMAWQADVVGNKLWNVYNKLAEKWEPTTIPANIAASQWVTVVAEFARTSSMMFHIGITINGVWHPVLIPHSSVPTTDKPYLNAGFQLDTTGAVVPPPYVCQVWHYNVSWS